MTSKSSSNNDLSRSFRRAGPYLNIGYTLFGSVILFAYLGHLMDRWSGQKPLFLIIGVFMGLFLGFYHMIKIIRHLDRK